MAVTYYSSYQVKEWYKSDNCIVLTSHKDSTALETWYIQSVYKPLMVVGRLAPLKILKEGTDPFKYFISMLLLTPNINPCPRMSILYSGLQPSEFCKFPPQNTGNSSSLTPNVKISGGAYLQSLLEIFSPPNIKHFPMGFLWYQPSSISFMNSDL